MAIEPSSISLDTVDSAALLSDMLAESPVGFARLNRDMEFVDINRSLAAIYGASIESHLHRHFSEIIGQELFDHIEPQLRQVIEHGDSVEMQLSREDGGATALRQMSLYWMPIRDAGREITGACVLAIDSTARALAEHERNRLDSQLHLALDAAGMGLWRWGASGANQIYWSAATAELLGIPADIPPSVEALAEVVDRNAMQAFITAIESALEAHHLFEHELRVVWPDRSVHWLLAKAQTQINDAGEMEMVGFFADVTERHTHQAEDARKSVRQARAGEQAVRMQRVTAALSQALTVAEVCDVLLCEGSAAIGAPRSVVALLNSTGDQIEQIRSDGYGDLASQIPIQELGDKRPVPEAIATGQPILIGTREEAYERYPAVREVSEATGSVASATFPLIQNGRALGAWSIAWLSDREFEEGELIIMLTLAAQGAQALERAQLYERERHIATSLQRAVLPRGLPKIKDLSMATRYRPGTTGVQVGGDWYDVIRLAPNRVGFVIGDVTGHNIDAAGVMGQIRNAIRSYAYENHAPARVLELTNQLLCGLEPGTFATCCYVDLNLDDGIATLATAGHPPPLVLDPQSGTHFVQLPPGTPLGTSFEQEYSQATHFLTPGNTIALYTDGLVESRSLGVLQGMQRLAAAAAANRDAGPEELADLLMHANEGDLENDDVALLVVNFQPTKGGVGRPRAIHRYLPPSAASAGVARRFAADVMADWGALDLVDKVELCVSELVTNALTHTAADVELILRMSPSSVRVEVVDHSDRMPILRPGGNEETSGRGLHIVEAISSAWGVDPAASGKSVWFQIERGLK